MGRRRFGRGSDATSTFARTRTITTLPAELAGLTKDDIEVSLEDGVLTISGEKKDDRTEETEGYHLRERRHGKFSRSFRLPAEVNPEKINAHLKDGVLTVTLDKAEVVKPRKIDVKAG